MNKTLIITTIALVAVSMGMSAVAPALATTPQIDGVFLKGCPNDFRLVFVKASIDPEKAEEMDKNGDDRVCQKLICPQNKKCVIRDHGIGSIIIIDNNVPSRR